MIVVLLDPPLNCTKVIRGVRGQAFILYSVILKTFGNTEPQFTLCLAAIFSLSTGHPEVHTHAYIRGRGGNLV